MKKKTFSILVKKYLLLTKQLTLIHPQAHAKDILEGPIKAKVLRVIDGDTIEVKAHIWVDQHIQTKIKLKNVQAPEIRGACDFEKDLAEQVQITTFNATNSAFDYPVELRNIEYGKYAGRVLADVTNHEGKDLEQILFDKGLAQPTKTGKRADWCGE